MNQISKPLLAIASILLILSVGGSATNVCVSAQNKNIKQFIVGFLREDGVLVPFAEYRHGLWWNPWPEQPIQPSENNEVVPKTLDGHPEPWFQQCEKAPTTWYLWSSADSRLALKTSETLQVQNHSHTNWGLMTDYPNKQKTEKNSHHNNVGIALSADLIGQSMIGVEKGNSESNEIIAYVKSAFNHSERDELDRLKADPATNDYLATRGFPSSSEQRSKAKLMITKLYRNRSSMDGQYIYYIEVEKQYNCSSISFLKGWVLKRKDGTLVLLNDRFGLTDCDGKERGESVELFSVLTINQRTFLFAVEHGWENETHKIYELKDFELALVLETV
jgi:hypothetical protein